MENMEKELTNQFDEFLKTKEKNYDISTGKLSFQITYILNKNRYAPTLKATEKTPEKRYKSASEFKFAIIDAIQRSKEKSLLDWIISHKILTFVMVALFILLVISFII